MYEALAPCCESSPDEKDSQTYRVMPGGLVQDTPTIVAK